MFRDEAPSIHLTEELAQRWGTAFLGYIGSEDSAGVLVSAIPLHSLAEWNSLLPSLWLGTLIPPSHPNCPHNPSEP